MTIQLEFYGNYYTVEPIYQKISHKYAFTDVINGFESSISTKFAFINTGRDDTFDKLVVLDKFSNTVCLNINARIRQSGETIFQGVLDIKKLTFDFENYTATGVLEGIENYIVGEEKEYNIYDITERQDVRVYEGELEEGDLGEIHDTLITGSTFGTGWTLVELSGTGYYVKEVMYVEPLVPSDWIVFSDRWERIVPTSKQDIDLDSGIGLSWAYCHTTHIYNGILMKAMLEYMFVKDGITSIVSNFFNINSDGNKPNNIAYEFAEEYLSNLIFTGGSEIQEAENQQSIYNISPKELWEDLKAMFWLKAVKVDNVLHVEHISHTKSNGVVDMLTNGKLIHIKPEYEYQGKTCYEEKYRFASETKKIDFNVDVSYSCGEQSNTTSTKHIVTNITEVANYDDKLILLACDQNNMVIREESIFESKNVLGIFHEIVLNHPLSWISLIKNLGRWGMYGSLAEIKYTLEGLDFGVLGSTPDIPKTIKISPFSTAFRKVQKFKIPMGIEDWLLLTPHHRINTRFGLAEIETVEYNTDNVCEFKIRHNT